MTNKRDALANAKRIVVKIGTATLTDKEGLVDLRFLESIAAQVAQLHSKGKEVIIVTSGAIGSGFREIGLDKPPRDIAMRQASFAVGQSRLMSSYTTAFGKHGLRVAQVLLTYDAFSRRNTYLNLRNAFGLLLRLGVVPIVNENDVVSIDEIGVSFGDNDRLSALVAAKLDAQLLVILSDIDGLCTADPKRDSSAERIPVVQEISSAVVKAAGRKGSAAAVGGMSSKIEAAKVAVASGCAVVIARGRAHDVLPKIVAGDDLGTLFLPKQGLRNRARWVLFSKPCGKIEIDEGARKALLKRKSLLAGGIVGVKGDFCAKDVVEIACEGECFARGIADFSAAELRKMKNGCAVKTENIYIAE